MKPGRRQLSFIFISLILLLSACDVMRIFLLSPNNDVRSIDIVSLPGANSNLPTTIDVVFVYDDALLGLLHSLTASDWFGYRLDLQNSYPGQIKVLRWEVIPGTKGRSRPLPEDSSVALAVLVFADYASAGNHSLDISNSELVKLELGETSIRVIQEDEI